MKALRAVLWALVALWLGASVLIALAPNPCRPAYAKWPDEQTSCSLDVNWSD